MRKCMECERLWAIIEELKLELRMQDYPSPRRKKWAPEQIRHLRKTLGMPQEEFARQIEVSVTSVGRWEKGTNAPTMLAAYRIQRLWVKNEDRLSLY